MSRNNRIFATLFLLCLSPQWCHGDEREPLNFSLLFQGGPCVSRGFLGDGNPAPEGGVWLGIRLSDHFDGLWGIDYYTLPSQKIQMTPTSSNPVTELMPSDDISITVNTRCYLSPRFNERYQQFNMVPYLLGGLGMDMVVDQSPRPDNSRFYNLYFDPLFAINLGMGLDIPIGDAKQWFIYGEGLDHLIIWQTMTQVYSFRFGVKVMLDSAHVDPFRGVI